MQITIKSVNVEWVAKGKTKYGKAVVEYVRDGKDNKQTLVSFKNPDVFNTIKDATEGSVFEITLTKEGDFWQWSQAKPASSQGAQATHASSGAAPATGGRVTGSNYETKEERAARQVLIVKQSSLAQAVEFYKLPRFAEDIVSIEDVLSTAQRMADWVFASDEEVISLENMPNDL